MIATARIGLLGRIGSGNLGNDGTFEALLAHLRSAHPDAVIDLLCSGPDVVTARYGLPARQMNRLHTQRQGPRWQSSLPVRVLRVGWSALADLRTTAAWVRAHDVVIVPGMGTLETTLPVKPWQLPSSLLCASIAGRVAGVRVAFVSVGASAMPRGLNRWLLVRSARLAHYRSFRDDYSRRQMGLMGVRVGDDEVHPDLAFALPDPEPPAAVVPRSVGVGVIDLASSDPEGGAAYERLLLDLVLWLVDHDRPVRLLIGDDDDTPVARTLMDRAVRARPGLPASALCFEPAATLGELSAQLATVETVVASRFHNVLCAVKAAKPTLSLGYAAKHRELMASVGTPEFALDPRESSLADVLHLLDRLDRHREQVVATLVASTARLRRGLEDQFRAVDALVGDSSQLPSPAPSPVPTATPASGRR